MTIIHYPQNGASSSTASSVSVTTGGFDGNLSPADDTVQKALDTVDDMSTGGSSTAAGTTVDTTDFDGNLSAADDTVQKALDTIDDMPASAGFVLYDIFVDASGGGNYTSIAAAITAEGADKSYFVKHGTYAETVNVTIPDCNITFDRVLITGGTIKVTVSSNATLIGDLEINTTGYGIQRNMIVYSGSYVKAEHFTCKLTPTAINTTDILILALITGTRADFGLIRAKDVTAVSTTQFRVITLTGGAHMNRLRVDIDTVNLSGGSSNSGSGVLLEAVDDNYITGVIRDMTNCRGFNLYNADYTTLAGVSTGCTDNYYASGGTGINVTGLNHAHA